MIYVALAHRLGLYKVGYSANLATRVVELAIAVRSPMTVVAAFRGTLREECDLHRLLAGFRAVKVDARKGCGCTEFYANCAGLAAWLDGLPASARCNLLYRYASNATNLRSSDTYVPRTNRGWREINAHAESVEPRWATRRPAAPDLADPSQAPEAVRGAA